MIIKCRFKDRERRREWREEVLADIPANNIPRLSEIITEVPMSFHLSVDGEDIPERIQVMHLLGEGSVRLNLPPQFILFHPREIEKYLYIESPTISESETSISVSCVFDAAAKVKPRSKKDVALHLAAEAGEVAECLIQPERGGNLVEESVDAIVCAIDLIYLELGSTHGTKEIAKIIDKKLSEKCEKWIATKS